MIQVFSSDKDMYGRTMNDNLSITIAVNGKKTDIIEEFLELYDYFHEKEPALAMYIDVCLKKRGYII